MRQWYGGGVTSKIIVSGADGFVGLHTVRALLDRGDKVVALDLKFDRLKETEMWGNPNLQIAKQDLTEKKVSNFIQEGDKILHLGAIATFGDARKNPQLAVKVNVHGTLNMVLASIEKKAERFVHASTGSVYSPNVPVPIREDAPREPRYPNIYGLTKKMAEDWVLFFNNQKPHIILRYGYIYGEGKPHGAIGNWVYRQIPKGIAPTIFGGDQVNDFVYVKDIVHANLLALETPCLNQVYNIGSGRGNSIKDVCELCLKTMGSDIGMNIEPSRPSEFPIFIYNINSARSLLRYTPKFNDTTGIADMVKNVYP